MRDVVWIFGFVAILAIITGCLFLRRFQTFYAPDSSTYVVPAANLLAGHGFVNSDRFPETNRTPGYSLLILLFLWARLDLRYLIIFQHVLRVLVTVATTAFAFRITKSRRTALLTGIVLCLDLPWLESANSVLTEMFFAATFTIALWLLWTEIERPEKPGIRCFAAGLLSGASTLIRPVSIFFCLPAAAGLLLVRKHFKLRAALGFVLAFCCFPLVWAARNYYETGYFTVSSISGVNMLMYRAAGAMAIDDPGDFGANLEKRQTQLQLRACNDLESLYEADCSKLTIPQKSAYYSRLGRKIILEHPLAYAKVALRGAAVMFLGGSLVKFREITGLGQRSGRALLLIYTVPVFCFAVRGLFILWAKNRRLCMLLLLVIGYFALISGGGETDSRFRVPISPLYAFAVAVGLGTRLNWHLEGHSD